MDYSKKKSLFNSDMAKKQMDEAFKPRASIAPEFKVPTQINKSAKVSVTYAIAPEVKQGIESLAKAQGFKSASAFVSDVLEQILSQQP